MNNHDSLRGTTVLVTRAAEQSNQFIKLLEDNGADVLNMPCLCISHPTSYKPLDFAISNLSQYDWIIFTSTNGIDYFIQRLKSQHNSLALSPKIAVVGEKTAIHLKKEYGLKPDFIPPQFVSDSLIASFPRNNLKGAKILYPQLEAGGRENIVSSFTALGAEVTAVPAYQSTCATQMPLSVKCAFESREIDIVTFASPKTVKCFHELIKASKSETILSDICIASIGEITSQKCHQILQRVDIEAQPYTLDGLVKAIINWKTNRNFN